MCQRDSISKIECDGLNEVLKVSNTHDDSNQIPVFVLGIDNGQANENILIKDEEIMDFAKKYEWGFGFAADEKERDLAIEDFAKITFQVGIPLRWEERSRVTSEKN